MSNIDFLIEQFNKNHNKRIDDFKELSNDNVLKDFAKWLIDKLSYDGFTLEYNDLLIHVGSDGRDFIHLFRSLKHAITDDGEITLCKIHVHQPCILDGYKHELKFNKVRKFDLDSKKIIDVDTEVIFYDSLTNFMKATDEWQKIFLKRAMHGDCIRNNFSIMHYKNYEYFIEVIESDESLKKLYLELI